MLTVLVMAITLFSCGEDKRSDYTTLDEDGNPTMTERSRTIIQDYLEEFKYCKKSSTKGMMDCKHLTAEALCAFYEIDDFKSDEHPSGFVNYEEMHDIIFGKFGTWKPIGKASEQSSLRKAQEKANNGQATVAVSMKSTYGHVAIILPGTLEKAPSWGGLKVPVCASFFLVRGLDSFAEKSLAYAWSSPEDIILYCKED